MGYLISSMDRNYKSVNLIYNCKNHDWKGDNNLIFCYGSDEFLERCKVFGNIKTWGTPQDNDVVIIGYEGEEGLDLALSLGLPNVFIVSPPSLMLWERITGTPVKWVGSLETLSAKAGIPYSSEIVPKEMSESMPMEETKNPQSVDQIQVVGADQKIEKNRVKLKRMSTRTSLSNLKEDSPKVEDVRVAYNVMSDKSIAKIIPVFSLKGGTGKTTISMNISAVLASTGKKVCLIDADLGTKSSTDYLLGEKHSEVSLLSWLDIQDKEMPNWNKVQSLLVKVMGSIYLLPGLPSLKQQSLITEDLTKYILNVLSIYFDYVILDFGPNLLPCTEVALKMCHKTILVGIPDPFTISAAIRTRNQIIGEEKLLHPSKVIFLVNCDQPRALRRPVEVARDVDLELAGTLPEDVPAIKSAINAIPKTLPVLLPKDTPLKRALLDITQRVIPDFDIYENTKESKKINILDYFINPLKKVRALIGKKNPVNIQ